jgi:uncharacterized protein
MTQRDQNRDLLTFLFLFLLLTIPPYALILFTGKIGSGTLIMWVPAEAALLTCALRKVSVASFGWKWRPVKYECYGYVLPILYALPVYLITWLCVRGSFLAAGLETMAAAKFGFQHHLGLSTVLVVVPVTATMGVITSTANALGEEIGWHGFFLPRLVQRFGFTVACLLHGTIWGLWHIPAILFADYSGGHYAWYTLTCFVLTVVGIAFITGWLRMKSGSLWPCAILHASHNLFLEGLLDPSTTTTGFAPHITSEFGFGLTITVWIVALYLWRRRGELPVNPHQDALPEKTSAPQHAIA